MPRILIFLLCIFSACPNSQAEPSFIQDRTDGSITLWRRSTNADLTYFIQALFQNIPLATKNPAISSYWPERFSILIDGNWKGSSGFSSPELVAPDGSPAILIRPEAAVDPSSFYLVVHELTHQIHYKTRPHEEAWLREGVALLAEYVLTGKLNPIIREGFRNPESSLTAALDPSKSDYFGSQHGHLIQYFYYLYRLCGQNAFFSKLLTSPSSSTGIAFLDETLRGLSSSSEIDPICSDFNTSFRAFEIARFSQAPYPKNAYVIMTSDRASVRRMPRDLPPYSAMAYFPSQIVHSDRIGQFGKVGSGCIRDSDVRIEDRCVRIRME